MASYTQSLENEMDISERPFRPGDLWTKPQKEHNPLQYKTLRDWDGADEKAQEILSQAPDHAAWVRGRLFGGKGFSKVYKVVEKRQNLLFAGKANRAYFEQLKREAEMLQKLDHEHIIKFKGWHEDKDRPENTLLLTELCIYGTLHEQVLEAEVFRRSDICRVIMQLGSALDWLHDRKMYHGDVNPQNIFVRDLAPLDVVLGDCGDVKPISEHGNSIEQTKRVSEHFGPRVASERKYISPQAAEAERPYGKEDDIWALGLTMMGMMGQQPRYRCDIHAYHDEVQEHACLLRDIDTTNSLGILMADMLAWNSNDRPTAAACYEQASLILGECPPLKYDVPQMAAEYAELRWLTLGFDGLAVPTGYRPITRWDI